MNPGPRMLELIRARGIPVVIGSDAHRPERVADGYVSALKQLEAAGIREVSFFLERKRQSVPVETALASLA
jgi:histidinol-phosphatase (PHP family)